MVFGFPVGCLVTIHSFDNSRNLLVGWVVIGVALVLVSTVAALMMFGQGLLVGQVGHFICVGLTVDTIVGHVNCGLVGHCGVVGLGQDGHVGQVGHVEGGLVVSVGQGAQVVGIVVGHVVGALVVGQLIGLLVVHDTGGGHGEHVAAVGQVWLKHGGLLLVIDSTLLINLST